MRERMKRKKRKKRKRKERERVKQKPAQEEKKWNTEPVCTSQARTLSALGIINRPSSVRSGQH